MIGPNPADANPADANPAGPDPADPLAHPQPADRAHPADRELPAYGTGHELQHAAHHAAVVLSEVTAGYDDRAALTDVTVAVAAGTLLAVFGPNGGGKSTFLKVVAGLLKPWSGHVHVLGAEPGREARRVAYVPQAEQVDWEFPVSVWDVVVMGRYPRLGPFRRPGPADHRAVADVRQQDVGHRRVVLQQIALGQAESGPEDLAEVREPDLLARDGQDGVVNVTGDEEGLHVARGSRRGASAEPERRQLRRSDAVQDRSHDRRIVELDAFLCVP